MAGMFQIGLQAAKGGFFDREAVRQAVDRGALRVLSRFGAYVRQRARTSIRVRESASAPGSPPHGHKSGLRTKTSKSGEARTRSVSLLREYILFSYDRETRTVIIGPAKLSGTTGPRALEALEYGGPSVSASYGRVRPISVRPRPYMRPAFAAELLRMPEDWRGAIRANQ